MQVHGLFSVDTLIEVPFNDLDPLEIVWHGNYLRYYEVARCHLLRQIDYDYPTMRESGYAWPIVECQLKYVAPAHFAQRLQITASLLEYEHRLKISYHTRDAGTNVLINKAITTQVAVQMKTGEMQFMSPAALTERVTRYLAAHPFAKA